MGAEVEQSSGAIELDNSKVTDDFKDNEVPNDAFKDGAVPPKRPSIPRGYSISTRIVDDGTMKTKAKIVWQNITQGGTEFDGFLLAASQEVGFSLLTFPFIFANLGMVLGVVLQLLAATTALYTCFLLVSLHAQYRHILKVTEHKKHFDKYHIVSYHEVMEEMVGKKMKWFSLTVVFVALVGLATSQIIASGSNMYLLSDSLSKRSWTLLWGFLFATVAFVPSFRHYRFMAFMGILATTYTGWFVTITSATMGRQEGAIVSSVPTDVNSFFVGFTSLLFAFGGHTSNIEVADVMDNPAGYDRSYFWSYIYIFTLTMPSGVTAYHSFGQEAAVNANDLALFPQSIARDVALVMMLVHYIVAFGLFCGPLFHMWEKMIHISDKPMCFRAPCRLPLCGLMILLAVAFPFFGAINAVLGAFTTSFGTYIIPAFAYNYAFKTKEGLVKPPHFNFKFMRIINWCIVVIVTGLGVGFGGYASIKNFIAQLDQYEVFAECYQC